MKSNVNKVEKILSFILALILVLSVVTGCAANKKLTEQEMEELKIEAKGYLENAKYVEAIRTYQKLMDGGCEESKYFGFVGTPEEAFEIAKGNAKRASIACRYASYTANALRNLLKDPASLVIYDVRLKSVNNDSSKFIVELDYGAKNSFGGMVRDSYSNVYMLSDSENKIVYESLKEWMDKNGATMKDSASYLVGNVSFISMGDGGIENAILNGTVTYY